MTEPPSIKQVIRVTRRLLQELGREPTDQEIGDEIGINADKVQEIIDDAQRVRKYPLASGQVEFKERCRGHRG